MRLVLFRLQPLLSSLQGMPTSRPRSAGVTAAATFAILGSFTAFSVWGYMFLNLVNLPADEQGHKLYQLNPKIFLLIALVPPSLIAALVRTAIGLVQLRRWARIGAMVWAALALFVSLWLIAFQPFETFVIPEHFVSQVESVRQLFAISFVFMLFPVSVWWLFMFRMKSVKAQFAPENAEQGPAVAAGPQNGTTPAPKAVT